MPVVGMCKLCREPSELLESHIIPRFVFAWMKRTSSTGFLRNGRNPNQRQQDGLKTYLLCAACESRLNAWETPFAAHVFLPFHEQEQIVLPYDDWLLKLCVSVSWRVLTYLRDLGHTAEMEVDFGGDVDAALATWAAFLLGQRLDTAPFQQNLVPLGSIKCSNGDLPAKRPTNNPLKKHT